MEQNLLSFIKYNKKAKKDNENENKNKIYLKQVKEYINLMQQKKLQKISYDYYINKPKISFISPIFNKEKYLQSLILCFQHQYIKEFEIIFIDDGSSDNSVKIINDFIKIDHRIKLIKNKINKGTLYSRIQGVFISKGEYLMFVDPDDYIFPKGLYNSYNFIKTKNLSIVQFCSIKKKNK